MHFGARATALLLSFSDKKLDLINYQNAKNAKMIQENIKHNEEVLRIYLRL